jgi:hypothetical protein
VSIGGCRSCSLFDFEYQQIDSFAIQLDEAHNYHQFDLAANNFFFPVR